MKNKLSDILSSLGLTLILLIILEIISTAMFPSIGLHGVKLAFNVVIVLFLAFRIDIASLPFLILSIQLVHSVFSIEGWAIGTLIGIIVSFLVSYLKDMLSFSTAFSTMVVVQIFQLFWFLITTLVICLKVGDFSKFLMLFWGYIPESILLSLVSPFFFILLNKIWKVDKNSSSGVSY